MPNVEKLTRLMEMDSFRMSLLSTVSSLNLPDCYIAAGFVRNLVWDHLHNYDGTPLNDVDVVYFSKLIIDENRLLKRLNSLYPEINWQLKNQAVMHSRNGDEPYADTVNAMEYWPEIETAIGVKLNDNRNLVFASPFDMCSIFNGFITHNKNRSRSIFLMRIEEKKWLERWPLLKVSL